MEREERRKERKIFVLFLDLTPLNLYLFALYLLTCIVFVLLMAELLQSLASAGKEFCSPVYPPVCSSPSAPVPLLLDVSSDSARSLFD